MVQAVNAALAELNGADGHDALHELLEAQAFRLAYWRVASDEINYRRFFDINELAALRMECEDVFEATHGFALELAAKGVVDGLRIDHPDGLYDPAQYFRRLQEGYARRAGIALPERDAKGRPSRPLYVLAEKIVAPHESVPDTWALHGTTGYRFAMVVNGVLVDTAAKAKFDRIWRAFSGEDESFEELAYQGKRAIMKSGLASELTVLSAELLRIARADRRTRDFTFNTLRQALAEIAACMPVYRTYIIDKPSKQDLHYIDWAVAQARRKSRAADVSIFDFVRRVLLAEAGEGASDELREKIRRFAMRFQQFTSPVAAKGVEDTAFYRYSPLISLNEVGGDPAQFGMSVKAFHRAGVHRAEHWPHTMLATSTHEPQALGRRARAHRRAFRDAGGLAAGAAPLEPHESHLSAHAGGRLGGTVARRRVPALPDAARHPAARRPGRGLDRHLPRPHAGLHAEGGARSQGAHRLGQPRR